MVRMNENFVKLKKQRLPDIVSHYKPSLRHRMILPKCFIFTKLMSGTACKNLTDQAVVIEIVDFERISGFDLTRGLFGEGAMKV